MKSAVLHHYYISGLKNNEVLKESGLNSSNITETLNTSETERARFNKPLLRQRNIFNFQNVLIRPYGSTGKKLPSRLGKVKFFVSVRTKLFPARAHYVT